MLLCNSMLQIEALLVQLYIVFTLCTYAQQGYVFGRVGLYVCVYQKTGCLVLPRPLENLLLIKCNELLACSSNLNASSVVC